MSMWKRRYEEPASQPLTTPKPVTVAPNPLEVNKEATPLSSMSSMPMKIEPDAQRGGSATIGKAVKVAGQIYSREDLYVDGDVEGNIELLEHRLTVGPHGKVQATIKARDVVVLGTIQGNVEARERLEIRKDAKLAGDIKTARIIIEDGAYFKGSIDIVKPEPVKAPAAVNRQGTAAAVTPVAPISSDAAEARR